MIPDWPFEVQDAESYISEAQDRVQKIMSDMIDSDGPVNEQEVEELLAEALLFVTDAKEAFEKVLA